jgi:large subunit ribosomal protein L24
MARGGLTIRKNDTVLVIAGREKGKRGKVLFVVPARERVVVEHVNMVKRHQRPTQKLRQGGIIEREAPLHVSNVMLVCSKCDKPTRVGMRVLADDRRARVCRRCGDIVDKA